MFSSRKDAEKNGHKKYYTGIPCVKGHITYRITKTAACAGCLRGYAKLQTQRNKLKKLKKYLDLEPITLLATKKHHRFFKDLNDFFIISDQSPIRRQDIAELEEVFSYLKNKWKTNVQT